MTTNARLSADRITLTYDDTTAVRSVSLSVPDGKITTIIGPNGCGKSTLLRALVRLKKPVEGSVVLDGQLIQHFPTRDVALRLGLMSQQATSPSGITVRDLVTRGRFPHQSFLQPPSREDLEQVEHAMTLANVTALADAQVDQLSGGQRQRAWIAMALAQETPIMLLDEPTTYLDLSHQLQVMELVRKLNQEERRTIVMVLHDVNEAARISDHIVAMKAGEVVAEGSPDEVIRPEVLHELFGTESDVFVAPGQTRPWCIPRGRTQPSPQLLDAANAVFEVDSVRTGYGKVSILHGLSCRMPAGAITAIVGPNACGKSTLLRTCSRLMQAKSGEVRLAGKNVRKGKHKELSRNLAFMTQSPAMPSGFAVEDLVSIGRLPHQGFLRQWGQEDDIAVESALNHCDLCGLRQRSIDTLSGGQRQRAWFGMTLAQDTPVLLLDEPTTFLDLSAQVEMLDLVREMNRQQNRSVIMVLHDLNLAARYCDFMIVMKDGNVVASGTPGAVLTTDLLRDVFEIEGTVLKDPATGAPIVIPERSCQPDAEPQEQSSAEMNDSATQEHQLVTSERS